MKVILTAQKVTESMIWIINFLKDKKYWVTPTEIGLAYGKSYNQASAWASPKCKKLVEKGFLERNKDGYYQLKEY